ncbi:helix-turn-helix domain-containing protein [Sphingomonas prati]|uniref:helix-turn-helix domain-containing protein n=1 Tax=Sphingomonas prati TaxID=1843237 RepID=UPI001E5835D3|nr:LysR family transcriptional regulator [Sphingomonas prati]
MAGAWVAEVYSAIDSDLWSGLAVFASIVEAGSFAQAATRLGLPASALSHAMRSVETKLGVRLLGRTTRSLSPTCASRQTHDARPW